MDHILCIQSFIGQYTVGLFPPLAIVNCAAINTDEHESLFSVPWGINLGVEWLSNSNEKNKNEKEASTRITCFPSLLPNLRFLSQKSGSIWGHLASLWGPGQPSQRG